MTTFLLLIVSFTLLVRGCFMLADELIDTVLSVRAHFAPRGVTSLDRNEVITRPQIAIATRGRFTLVEDAMIDA